MVATKPKTKKITKKITTKRTLHKKTSITRRRRIDVYNNISSTQELNINRVGVIR
jgi:hypothetical protein